MTEEESPNNRYSVSFMSFVQATWADLHASDFILTDEATWERTNEVIPAVMTPRPKRQTPLVGTSEIVRLPWTPVGICERN